jgi:DNA-binding NtrC family response regulator
VLLVEDEVLIRAAVAEALRSAGCSVIEADSADEALAYLSDGGQVDLLLTDVEMPGRLNGLELARQFHTAHPTLPVIVTSGHVRPETAEAIGTFISKPYAPERVAATVAEALRWSRRDREE